MKLSAVKNKGLFITGTDTDVGKTVISGTLLSVLNHGGEHACGFKPLASGCLKRNNDLVSEDGCFLHHFSAEGLSLAAVSPVCFSDGISPLGAALKTNQPIPWHKIQHALNEVQSTSTAIVVEGVGGVYAPLDENYTVLDMMVELQLPVVIVAQNKLGTINHTLLTVNACLHAGLTVAAVVINEIDDAGDPSCKTNIDLIRAFIDVETVISVPFAKEFSVTDISIPTSIYDAMQQVDWVSLMCE